MRDGLREKLLHWYTVTAHQQLGSSALASWTGMSNVSATCCTRVVLRTWFGKALGKNPGLGAVLAQAATLPQYPQGYAGG